MAAISILPVQFQRQLPYSVLLTHNATGFSVHSRNSLHSYSSSWLRFNSRLCVPILNAKESDFNALASLQEEENDLSLQDETPSSNAVQEAISNFIMSDIEEATQQYDIEDEFFAEIDYAQINAFSDRPFSGNPAAVCYLPLMRDDQWLQLVAREFNLSETAFIMRRNSGKKRLPPFFKRKSEDSIDNDTYVDEFDLRWFTPSVEVDLCGHATLASAHLLFSSGLAEGDTCLFHTRSGILKARKVSGYDAEEETKDEENDSNDLNTKKKRPTGAGVIELDFPLAVYTECKDTGEAEQVSTALGGVKIVWIGKTSLGDYLVEVSSSKEVAQVQPQFSSMLNYSGRGGVIVTALAENGSEVDFVSRFFCPKSGISEDPVTGSAHCALGPYWSERLKKTTLKAFQASERGGNITIHVDTEEGRAYLQGSAVIVMAGVLLNTWSKQSTSVTES